CGCACCLYRKRTPAMRHRSNRRLSRSSPLLQQNRRRTNPTIRGHFQTRTRISAKPPSNSQPQAGLHRQRCGLLLPESLVMARPNKRFVRLRDAIEYMRNGQSLVRMHVPCGQAWFIAPRGGEVTTETAEALLARNDVQPGGDGLFKGC